MGSQDSILGLCFTSLVAKQVVLNQDKLMERGSEAMSQMFFLETDWDVDRVTTLLSEVENFPGTTVQSDKLKWRYPGMGFSV